MSADLINLDAIARVGDTLLSRRRIGEPEFLNRALLHLVDPARDFVTGTRAVLDDAQQSR
ncbi:hypothetical protein [Brevundimonas vesicularis]|uniref:Uncharacterized protein n=1 Tax=Brevundimonas vesicularis TaxID=41276 RepID=A0ABU4KRZ8_BREVE|nr:hypothetical protein [Brevundimonas vesicularis]MDX2335763.1 hypothetical protein [Brevundimonas vesicularis]